ncbi:hypothetical protein [Azospirillum sp.]|uniref:hypothetical protein n=1 Tax=Azospirillum sp. TaxID=34012 RepID=UPI002D326A5B|nr:hypothetical protein [Azospirillum sp.]HYD67042.1 hypothetical protein [Azospirillum sp.]
MTHAFAKDSRACAACVSWSGQRALAADNTLVEVPRYSVEGECRTAISQDYRKVRKSYHTCDAWSPLPLLRAHGGRTDRTPGPAAAMAAIMANAPAGAAVPVPPAPAPVAPAPKAVAPKAAVPVLAVEPEVPRCSAAPLDIDKVPPQARVLHTYWTRLKRQRPMPGAREVDTAQVRDCVARLALLEPIGGGADFVYRACGKALAKRLGQRPVSRLVSACHPEDAAARWLDDLRACLEEGAPRSLLVRDDPILPGQKFVELLLPLADDQGRPAFVLAYRHLPGG